MFHRSVTNISQLKKEIVKQFVNSFDNVLTDCGGVLWIDATPLEKSANVLNRFREMGKNIFYVTNISTMTREEVTKKCKMFHFEAIKEEVITSSYLTAQYLKNRGFMKKVFIIGHSGIAKELDLIGISHSKTGPEVFKTDFYTLTQNLKLDPHVGAVVVGYDEHLSFPKILRATSYLKNPECLFIATNMDATRPTTISHLAIPADGAMVSAVQAASHRIPLVMGKPGSHISNFFLNQLKLQPQRSLMIGDNCFTDIAFGIQCNFQTLLVLSGVTTFSDLIMKKTTYTTTQQSLIPDAYINKLGDLYKFLD